MIFSTHGILSKFNLPFPSIANLVTDFDFSDSSKVTLSSGKISQISDEISGLVSSQATSGNQPAYVTDGSLNNTFFGRFTGSQQLTGNLFTSGTDFTIFFLRKVNANTNNARFGSGIFQNGNSASAGYGFCDFQNPSSGTENVSGYLYPAAGTVSSDSHSYSIAAKWEVWCISHSSGSNKLYNTLGSLISQDGANPNTPTGGHIIGAMNWGGTSGFNGDLSRLLVYNRQLTDSEVQTVCQYLYKKNTLQLPNNVLFGGHSKLTSQGGAPSAPDQVTRMILSDGRYIYYTNTSVGGRSIANVVTGLPTEVQANYRGDIKNIYTIMIGHNDLASSTDVTGIYNSLVSLCQTVRNYGYHLIIMTELYSTAISNATIDTYNSLIKTNWSTFADAIADSNALPNAANPSNTTYFGDGVHPTSLLDTDIATLLKPIIENFLDV